MEESVLLMEEDEAIAALMTRLESFIEKVIERKFTERDQKIEELAKTLKETYALVNGRMTELTAALEKGAALAEALAGEKGEERGEAKERARAKEEAGKESAPDG